MQIITITHYKNNSIQQEHNSRFHSDHKLRAVKDISETVLKVIIMAAKSAGLRDFLHQFAKKNGYGSGKINLQDVSSEGASFTSTLHLATISAPAKKDLKLFAKFASVSETLRAADDTFTKAFKTECTFYSKLAVAFQGLYDKNGVAVEDRMHLSKYYGHQSTENNEILILEDLTASGFGCFDRFKTIDWNYAEAAVKEMAKFHALGIAAKKEGLGEFKKIKEIGLDMFNLTMKDVLVQHAYKIGTEMVKEEYRSRLQKFFNKRDLVDDFAILWKTYDDGYLIHSDFKTSNLMHRKQSKTLGLLLGLALIPILNVDPEDAPKSFENDQALAVKPNQRALDKINDILGDYVKWGII